jgi:hypothetical protein
MAQRDMVSVAGRWEYPSSFGWAAARAVGERSTRSDVVAAEGSVQGQEQSDKSMYLVWLVVYSLLYFTESKTRAWLRQIRLSSAVLAGRHRGAGQRFWRLC